MSKTRRKNRSEAEHLNGQIRKLESENRQLKKRLKALDKKSHFYEELVNEVSDDVELKNVCQACFKGTLSEHDFKHIIITKCDNCKYQKSKKT